MSYSPIHIGPVGGRGAEPLNPLLRPRTSSTFDHLLNETIQKNVVNFTNGERTLPKSQIIAIINDICLHLDALWIQTILRDGNKEWGITTPMPLFTDQSALTKMESSNNCRDILNRDDFNGPSHLEIIIADAARAHGVDEALVKSVIKVESDFNPNCTSPKGAMGLMQLMPETARELGVLNAYDPVQNIEAGTRYLKMLLTRYGGSVPLALAAYNWGMGNLEKRPAQMPTETRRYVDRVSSYCSAIKT
jgi:hypothetical protein